MRVYHKAAYDTPSFYELEKSDLFSFERDGIDGGDSHEVDDLTLRGVAVGEVDRFLQSHLDWADD